MYTRRVLFRILTQALGGASLAILGSIRLFLSFLSSLLDLRSRSRDQRHLPLSIHLFLPSTFRPRNPAKLDSRGIFLFFFTHLCQNPEIRGSKTTDAEVFIVEYQEKGGDPPGSDNRVADNGTQDPAKVDLFMNKKSSLMKGQAT